MSRSIATIIDIFLFLWILFLSSYITYGLLNDKVSLFTYEQMYVPVEVNRIPNNIEINIEQKELKDWVSEKKITLSNNDYYSLSDGVKKFLISDTEDSFNYWFITRKKWNNITYLFSHNSYKYTENSWYYIYNNWKEGDIITFDNKDQYIIRSTKMYDFNTENYWDEKTKIETKIIYFTCTPYGDNIRKAYFLERVK